MEVLWQIIRTVLAAIVLVIGAMAVWWWVPKWQMRSVAQQEGVDQSKSRATAALPRLSQLSSTVKERASPLWNSARLQFARGRK
jgi:hypothetical protein